VEIADLLPNVEMFEGLTDRQVKRVANLFEVRTFQQDEFLFIQGDKADHLFVVMDGFFEVIVRGSKSSQERVIVSYGMGQSIGEISYMDRGNRSASVRAASSNATVAVVSFEAFEILCKAHPRIGYRIIWNIAADLAFRLREQGRHF
jgi:CRP/FNR family cyclic AMP-dependent transcriptional regulator